MWFINKYFKNCKIYCILLILLLSLLSTLIIHNKYYKNENFDNDYPKIIEPKCSQEKKKILKIYNPSKKTVTFNTKNYINVFNKKDPPLFAKNKNNQYCIEDSDCIIEDPCTKLNCNYRLHPTKYTCVQNNFYHNYSEKKNCKDKYVKPILDKSKEISIGLKSKLNAKNNSNKVCKHMHNNERYIAICTNNHTFK